MDLISLAFHSNSDNIFFFNINFVCCKYSIRPLFDYFFQSHSKESNMEGMGEHVKNVVHLEIQWWWWWLF